MTIKKFFLIASMVILSMANVLAQAPQGFTYQAVVRDANGKLITNAPIGVRMTILQGSSTGTVAFSDEYRPQTNANGLFSIVIGDGVNSINSIDWAQGPYFLKSEVDPNGGNNYTINTVQQLLSVPYALHAQTASNVSGGINYDSLTNKPTNISYFTNDAGYLTSYTETQVLSKNGDTLFLTGGSYVVLPAVFSGNYNDLSNKPKLFSGNYDSLTNKPNLFSGSYNDLSNKPHLFSGNYDSLTNKPAIPTKVSDLTNDAGYLTSYTETQVLSKNGDTLFLTGGSYVVLPAGFSGNYNDLNNKPHLFSGNYDSLTNKPTNISYFTNDAGYLTSYTETQVLSKNGDTLFLTGGSYVVLPAESQTLSDVAQNNNAINAQVKNLYDPTDSLDAVNLRILNRFLIANNAELIHRYDSILTNLNSTIDTLRQTSGGIALPMVITADVSDTTSETATLGGSVVYSGNSVVSARGICWATTPNPTISNSHTTDGIGVGNFTSNITGLTAGTTYYVRAYATNSAGTAYGNQVSFTTSSVFVNVPFSVSATDRVYFSPGNLQWSATNGGSTYTTHIVAGGHTADGTWRFAPNQLDMIGTNNQNISSTYTGWIDLFGWGTSGYNNKYPYMTSTTNSDYGSGTHNNISGTNYDWGLYNAIYNPQTNTTDAPGTWRTLTKDEWVYLMNTRSTSSGVRYAKANVMGTNGVIIVPDNWSTSIYILQSTNTSSAAYTANIINYTDWIKMVNAGCVFLPAAGYRNGTSDYDVGSVGYYWPGTCYNYDGSDYAYRLFFSSSVLNPSSEGFRGYGRSVRLVRSAQ